MRIVLETVATTYGSGPFYPAIRTGSQFWYWPNITKASVSEAMEFAAKALADAQDAANAIASQWNIYEV